MAKYTPGPWVIDWNVGRLDIHADGTLVASLRRSTKDGAPTYDDAEAKANARLIAAAPALYEALRKAREFVADDRVRWFNSVAIPDTNVIPDADDRALIAKYDAALAEFDAALSAAQEG